MPLYQDSFDGRTQLGSMPGGGPAYSQYNVGLQPGNVWTVVNGRPVSTELATNSPIAYVEGGAGNFDIKIDVSPFGGDALYGRASATAGQPLACNNFVRARVRRWETVVPTGYTQYRWQRTVSGPSITEYRWSRSYFHQSSDASHVGLTGPTTLYAYREAWSTSNTNAPFLPVNYGNLSHAHGTNGSHSHNYYASGDTFLTNDTRQQPGGSTIQQQWSFSQFSSPWQGSGNEGFYTNYSEFVPGESRTTYYQAVLEKVVNGSRTQLGASPQTTSSSSLSSLRLRGEGSSLQVFISGSAVAGITASDTFNQTVPRHGFGRALSDQSGTSGLDNFSFNELNTKPGPPTLTFPAVGQILNRAVRNQLRQSFNDIDGGDTRSKLEQRWRLAVPAGETVNPWTVVPSAGSVGFIEYPAGTFPAGSIDWSGRDADASGQWGDWSANSSFVSAVAPPGPVIVEPIAGSTIPGATSLLRWTSTNQAAFRVRIARGGEAPFDSGVVQGASTQQFSLTHPFNNTAETITLTTYSAEGLESAEAVVGYSVAYTPPSKAISVLTTVPEKAGLRVQVVNPSNSPEPVGSNTIHVRETLNPSTSWPGARDVPANGFWTYLAPGSETEYEFRVDAVGMNGTTQIGDWNGALSTPIDPTVPIDPTAPTTRAFGEGDFGEGTFGGPLA